MQLSGGADFYFSDTGKVSVETVSGQPLVIDRSQGHIKSVGLEGTGAGGRSVTLVVSAQNLGAIDLSLNDPAYGGGRVDCSDLNLESEFSMVEQLFDRLGSGF